MNDEASAHGYTHMGLQQIARKSRRLLSRLPRDAVESAPAATSSASEAATAMEYPAESDLESCLRKIAYEAGDSSGSPFRINMVRLHGKPPMYSVVILSPKREPLRQRLGQLLSRNFSLGVTSIMLTVADAQNLLGYCQSNRQQ
jgi:hypothetical protein